MPNRGGIESFKLVAVLALGSIAWACSSPSGPKGGGTGGEEETGGSSGDTGGKSGEGTGGKQGGTGGSSTGGSMGNTGGSGDTGGSGGSTGGAGGSSTGGAGGKGGSGGSTGGVGGKPDGGAGMGGAGGGGAGGSSGELTFTGDFSMMGNRLCFKRGNTGGTGQKSPKLDWSGIPAGAMSLVVSLRDNSNSNVHWMACNIPTSATGLPAGVTAATLPMGASQTGSWYGPGAGDVHQYEYKLWVMKVPTVMCSGLSQQARNMLWTTLKNDEAGGKAMVLVTKAITAYGDTDANCM